MQGHDIVVIGASAGGFPALQELLGDLPADLAAAVFVVVHGSSDRAAAAAKVLSRMGTLPVLAARHGAPILNGRIYVARSDQRMILEEGRMSVVRCPRSGTPSTIDSLFRSAALAHGSRVIGVVLSGLLSDGAAGLLAIQQQGGETMVQTVDDALYGDMPRHALAAVAAGHVLPASSMGMALQRLTAMPAGAPVAAGGCVAAGARLRMQVALDRLGAAAPRACDQCGTAVAEDAEGALSFQCAGGHWYAAEGVVAGDDAAIADALWAVLDALVESAALKRRLAQRVEDPEAEGKRGRLQRSARRSGQQATAVRRVLRSMRGPGGGRPS